MAYLFLISILQKCSFPLMIQRFFLFEKTNVKTRTIIDFLTIKIKKKLYKKDNYCILDYYVFVDVPCYGLVLAYPCLLETLEYYDCAVDCAAHIHVGKLFHKLFQHNIIVDTNLLNPKNSLIKPRTYNVKTNSTSIL